MKEKFCQLIKEEEGATAVEYGIMIAAIAAVIIGIVYTIGDEVRQGFATVKNNLVNH
jgi:pilus assembly protein Flp/PilA